MACVIDQKIIISDCESSCTYVLKGTKKLFIYFRNEKILARGYYYNFGVVAVVVGRVNVDDGGRGGIGGDIVGFIKLP